MKTDRELLGMAAKAFGLAIDFDSNGHPFCTNCCEVDWNPIEDDGDALRLAVRLGFDLIRDWNIYPEATALATISVVLTDVGTLSEEPLEDDPYLATRRAIVRAAAAIGEQMK